MAITKAKAAETVPFTASDQSPPQVAPVAAVASGGIKSLTIKLSDEEYRALQKACFEEGQATARRVTHQERVVRALRKDLGL